MGLLIFIIAFGLEVVAQSFLVILAIKHKGQIGPVALAVSQVMAFFTNTFIGPIYAAGLALFYFDQRVRKEGYDIEWMMQAAGLAAPDTPQVPQQNPGDSHE
jgi:vacuolar-type H+-ATPase subunit I/STV1